MKELTPEEIGKLLANANTEGGGYANTEAGKAAAREAVAAQASIRSLTPPRPSTLHPNPDPRPPTPPCLITVRSPPDLCPMSPRQMSTGSHSRAFYRVAATRSATGGEPAGRKGPRTEPEGGARLDHVRAEAAPPWSLLPPSSP